MSTGKMIALIKGIGGGSGSGGGGASLPAAAPYQQLVTDGDGKWVAADRLAYKAVGETELLPETTVTVAEVEGSYGAELSGFSIDILKDYVVILNGTSYRVTPYEVRSNFGENVVLLGSRLQDEESFTFAWDYPFVFMVAPWGCGVYFQSAGDYTISIQEIAETIHPIPDEYLPTTFVPTAVIKSSDYDNALAGVPAVKEEAVTYECTNMTFEEAYQLLASGKPLQAVALVNAGGPSCINAMVAFAGTLMGVPCLVVACSIVGEEATPAHVFTAYWTADGLSTEAPI